MMRRTFEDGGHRGNDPFGYGPPGTTRARSSTRGPSRSCRRRPRSSGRFPAARQAPVLRNRRPPEPRRGPTPRPPNLGKNAVKDLWRRREVYRGNVTSKRGLEVIAGKHRAILSPEEFRDAAAGVERRVHRRGSEPWQSASTCSAASCSAPGDQDARDRPEEPRAGSGCTTSARCRRSAAHGSTTTATSLPATPAGSGRRDRRVRAGRARTFRLPGRRDRGRPGRARAASEGAQAGRHRPAAGAPRRNAGTPGATLRLGRASGYRLPAEGDRGLAERLDSHPRTRKSSCLTATGARSARFRRRWTPRPTRSFANCRLLSSAGDGPTAVARVVCTAPAWPFFAAVALFGVAPPDGFEPPTRTLGRCALSTELRGPPHRTAARRTPGRCDLADQEPAVHVDVAGVRVLAEAEPLAAAVNVRVFAGSAEHDPAEGLGEGLQIEVTWIRMKSSPSGQVKVL